MNHFSRTLLSQKRNVLGLMSGTSLDGLDMALVAFDEHGFSFLQSHFVPYTDEKKHVLSHAHECSGEELAQLHMEYGAWLGKQVLDFSKRYPQHTIDLVSSHGHTVFHQPQKQLTYQLGDGAVLANVSGFPVINDFRKMDVWLGGQGAPLVPVGDVQLFPNYDGWLNLGGMANITIRTNVSQILAWDLGPCNMILNTLSERLGQPFDPEGSIAAAGSFLPELAEAIRTIPYFNQRPPKSLGREWVEVEVFPLVKDVYATEDALHTFTLVLAQLFVQQIPSDVKKILVSGGGAKNTFFVKQLHMLCPGRFEIASNDIMDGKEAIIFAYLGWLRWEGKVNVFASVTGAPADHSAGEIHFP